MQDHITISGKGPYLILVHGIGATRRVWKTLMPRLNKNFTVVRYDLRGHGDNPTSNPQFELDLLIEDLEQIRQRLSIDQAHFAGHSLGGMIVPAYARKYPDHVITLSLLSTAAGRSTRDRENVWQVIDKMVTNGVSKVLPTLVDRWFTDNFATNHPAVVAVRLKQVLDTDESVFLNVFRIYANTEMLPWLHEIKKPVLIVTGESDVGCSPGLNRKINKALSNSKLIVLPGLKHAVLLEAGPQIADAICNFTHSRENSSARKSTIR